MPALSAVDVPSADELRFMLLENAAKVAVSHQNHDNPHLTLRVTIQPSGWLQALLRRARSARVWLMMDTPFDGLCLGVDRQLYMLNDDDPDDLTVTCFEVTACTPHDVDQIIDVLCDMSAPPTWK